MTAWQRSKITERSEKGLGAISFKRLLMGGGAGAAFAMIGGRVFGFFPACIGGGILMGFVLGLTHSVEGLPLVSFGFQTLRGLAVVARNRGESGFIARIGEGLNLAPDEGVLDADTAFAVEEVLQDFIIGDDDDMEYLGSFGDVGREGLRPTANPFEKGGNT